MVKWTSTQLSGLTTARPPLARQGVIGVACSGAYKLDTLAQHRGKVVHRRHTQRRLTTPVPNELAAVWQPGIESVERW